MRYWIQHLWRMECSFKRKVFYFSLLNFFFFLHFQHFLSWCSYFLYKLYSHIFISIRCLAIFSCDMFEPVHVVLFSHIFISIALLRNFLIRYVWTCSIYIYIWSKMFKDVFKPVHFHCDAEVRNFFKFHISQLLFSSSAAHVYTFVYLLKWLKSFFFFLHQVNINRLQQCFNRRSIWIHVYHD